MRIARVDVTQRYRGQTDAGSWTARTFARFGGAAVIAVLALSCLGLPAARAAAAHGHAGDPSPQAAPGSSPSTPAPDPAPQAATRSTPVRTSSPSIPQTDIDGIDGARDYGDELAGRAGADSCRHSHCLRRRRARHIGPGAPGLASRGPARVSDASRLDSSRAALLPARAAEGPAAPAARRRSGSSRRRAVAVERRGDGGRGGGELHAVAAAAEAGGGMKRLVAACGVLVAV